MPNIVDNETNISPCANRLLDDQNSVDFYV